MYFDEKAKQWDNDPRKQERAAVFAKEITDFIRPQKQWNALEFGCGTGLLSFRLKDFFHTITLLDKSEGMIAVLKKKIEEQGVDNFIPLAAELFDKRIDSLQTKVIFTLMTLHHILDIDKVLSKFSSLLLPEGFLCIADLVLEDGTFHAHHTDFEGHNGFDRQFLSEKMCQSGLQPVFYKECFVIKKEVEGKEREYPLFLMIGKKVAIAEKAE